MCGVVLLGCGAGSSAQQLVDVPAFEPTGQTKCAVKKSQTRPLIVEWPAADRGALEAQRSKGLVAVRYDGCEMEVMRQCTVPGDYGYTPVTPKEDHISITNADELYASIPVYAAKFEGKLATSGHLDVEMVIVGSFEADRARVTRDELDGACESVTHFVSALTAGAFEFTAGGNAEVSGGVDVVGAGAGAKSTAERELLNRDGYKKACADASSEDVQPPEGCGALLRVEVVKIEPGEEPDGGATTDPLVATDKMPELGPGVVKVHISSEEPVQLIRLGAAQAVSFGGIGMNLGTRELVCTSPCDSWVDGRKGAQFIIGGDNVIETDSFQLAERQGEITMDVDAGSATSERWGGFMLWTGIPLLAGGGVIIGTGAGIGRSATTFIIAGSVFAGVGAVLTGIGIHLMLDDTEYQVGMDDGGNFTWRF
jgi:hypothetical protein